MQRIKFVSLSLILGIAFSISLSTFSHSTDEGPMTVQGNIVCLLPDYENGTVKPVIATGSCDRYPPHFHVLVTATEVYQLQGSQQALMKIEQSSNRINVKITGTVKWGEQTAWVLFVD